MSKTSFTFDDRAHHPPIPRRIRPAILPAPAVVSPGRGTYAVPSTVRLCLSGVVIAGPLDDALAHISTLDGRTAMAEPAGGRKGDVALRLVTAEPLFDELMPTQGVSPADCDPHDERYVIEVTETGIDVRAIAVQGLVRALSAVTQLIGAGTQDDGVIACQTIVDGPRFAWRGLSLDVVRTFFTPQQVKTVIDMLALLRMNVLHLHLTDSQGWRLEIPSLPVLTEIGSRGAIGDRPGGYYSPSAFADLVDYAAERYITIVPEIDVPGHTGAIFASYPELRPPQLPPAMGPIAIEYLDPRMVATHTFLAVVFSYVASIAPGAYVHIGGDEAFGMPEELYEEFIRMVMPIVRDAGKKVVGWQEIARGELVDTDVVQYWISGGPENVEGIFDHIPPEIVIPEGMKDMLIEQFRNAAQDVPKAQAQGARILLSPTRLAYLDAPLAEASADPVQEARRAALGLGAYAATTAADSVSWDLPDAVPEVEFDGVIGVEAAIWTETVHDEADLHMLLLPRLAGIAEKAWSPRGSAPWDEYSVRLAAQGPLWRAAGWRHFESSMVDWR